MHLNSCKITCKNIIFQDNVNFDTYTMRDHLIKCKLIQNNLSLPARGGGYI